MRSTLVSSLFLFSSLVAAHAWSQGYYQHPSNDGYDRGYRDGGISRPHYNRHPRSRRPVGYLNRDYDSYNGRRPPPIILRDNVPMGLRRGQEIQYRGRPYRVLRPVWVNDDDDDSRGNDDKWKEDDKSDDDDRGSSDGRDEDEAQPVHKRKNEHVPKGHRGYHGEGGSLGSSRIVHRHIIHEDGTQEVIVADRMTGRKVLLTPKDRVKPSIEGSQPDDDDDIESDTEVEDKKDNTKDRKKSGGAVTILTPDDRLRNNGRHHRSHQPAKGSAQPNKAPGGKKGPPQKGGAQAAGENSGNPQPVDGAGGQDGGQTGGKRRRRRRRHRIPPQDPEVVERKPGPGGEKQDVDQPGDDRAEPDYVRV